MPQSRSKKLDQKDEFHLIASQQQLIQSEKLASIGMIAAGVAHEINNPLGYVQSNLETLKIYQDKMLQFVGEVRTLVADLGKEGTNATSTRLHGVQVLLNDPDFNFVLKDQSILAEECLIGVCRISETIRSLKVFTNVSTETTQETDIHECIEAALRVAANELKYKCEVVKEFGVVPKMITDTGALLQVLMSLLINAAHAIEKRGRIVIRTSLEKKFVRVAIADNGVGISDENLKELFKPFFTTKPKGQGTGLGLSSSRAILEKLGGEILVDSFLGRGSTFTVLIPERQRP